MALHLLKAVCVAPIRAVILRAFGMIFSHLLLGSQMQTTVSINKYKSRYIRFHFSRQTAATVTIWSLHQSLIGLCWMNFRHVTVGHVVMTFTPHGPATKHRSRPQRDGQPSQRKLYCFPISALSVMRVSSHRNTAHKQAAGAVSGGFLTT